jgi:hypothetical protein
MNIFNFVNNYGVREGRERKYFVGKYGKMIESKPN